MKKTSNKGQPIKRDLNRKNTALIETATVIDARQADARKAETFEFELDLGRKYEFGLPREKTFTARSRTWTWGNFTFVGDDNGESLAEVTDFTATLSHVETSSSPYYNMWLTVSFRIASLGWYTEQQPVLTVALKNSAGGVLADFTNFGYNPAAGYPPEFKIGCGGDFRRTYTVNDLMPDYYDLAVKASRHWTASRWRRC